MSKSSEKTEQATSAHLTEKVTEGVEAWYAECVRNSPISAETRAYNHAVESKAVLIQRILEALVS